MSDEQKKIFSLFRKKDQAEDKISETVLTDDIETTVPPMLEEPPQKPSKKEEKGIPLALSKIERFTPTSTQGLAAEQVETRKKQGLINVTNVKYTKSYANIIFGNVFSFFNCLCFLVAAALALAECWNNLLFIAIILINITIAVVQEILAKKTVDKLSLISSPTATVVRDGILLEIPLGDIVLDDVIALSIGKQIPTDSVVIDGSIEVNESLLTGESVPVKKNVGDLLYAGSFVSSGSCRARAEHVGKDNYVETLTAKAKKYQKPKSELLGSIKLITTVIGIAIVPIAFAIAMTNISVIRAENPLMSGYELYCAVVPKTATVIIGMIPAGMFLLTSTALGLGVWRLAKHQTSVKDMYSLEMLARVDVLCLDKTGTITDGRMKVADCVMLSQKSEFTLSEVVGSMLAATNDNNQTAHALYNHFGHNNTLKATAIMPFSSKRKLSAVTFQGQGTFIMGAPEFVLAQTSDKLSKLINSYASRGMRVLVLAHSPGQITGDKLPGSVRPVALISLTDNIRDDAITTVRWFRENDVAVKVISGDNPVTVSEVARRVGIPGADRYISLENLTDREVEAVALNYTVFGRVSPEQKAVLVKALKHAGKTVAMTGDGVNDILAMKEADCSISVASGSDAARNVAHLLLLDNNFSSMPKIVYEGRRVINNIQRSASLFLMKTVFTLLFSIFMIIAHKEYPFTTSQMLLLESFIIGIPSTCLALQANSNRVQGRFIGYVMARSIPGALIMFFNVMVFYLVHHISGIAMTQAQYETLSAVSLALAGWVVLCQICRPFNTFRAIVFGGTTFLISFLLFADVPIIRTVLELGRISDMVYADNWTNLLLLSTLVMIDFPILSGLIKFCEGCRTYLYGIEQQHFIERREDEPLK
ncbi:MAG: HAD-IC family P-type ATPase, partial [Clostridia bacterium]|nr:HAD-IC family P-type ATPase [Clostridia bacterium]